MRTAFYMDDGVTQAILTPDTEMDKAVLAAIEAAGANLTIKRGGFYECQGGWVRQIRIEYGLGAARPDSLMLVVTPKRPTPETP